MDKIKFEDGKLIEKAYVMVNDEKKEVQSAVYEGKTPLKAYNLNKMQDNLENATKVTSLIPKGNSVQKTREGYNNFNEEYTIGYITGNTGVQNTNGSGATSKDYIEIKQNETIYILINALQPCSIGRVFIMEYDETYNAIQRSIVPGLYDKKFSSIGTYKFTISPQENCKYIKPSFYALHDSGDISITPVNEKIKDYLQICISSTEVEQYESYGKSPSIEYEAPIKSVGDNINLFNKYGDFNYGNENHKTSLQEDGTILSTANSWSIRSSGILIENLEKNTNYTVSGILVSANGTGTQNAIIEILSTVPTTSIERFGISPSVVKPYKFEFEFNTGERNSIWLSINGSNSSAEGDTITIFDKIKLEKGPKATGYSPYGQGSIDIKIQNENLYNYKDILSKSEGISTDDDGWITVTKDNTSGSSQVSMLFFSGLLELKNDNQYNVIIEIKNVEGTGQLRPHSPWGNHGQFSTLSRYNNVNFTDFKNGQILIAKTTSKSSFEGIIDGIDTYIIFAVGQSGSITFRLSVLEDTAVTPETFTYVPHQGQNIVVPTQKPFRAIGDIRDKFVKINGMWNEKHDIFRYIFSGTERISKRTSEKCPFGYYFYVQIEPNYQFVDNNSIPSLMSSNYFNVVANDVKNFSYSCMSATFGKNTICFNIDETYTTESQVSELFKQKMAEGKPAYVDYVLEEPELIPCTSEQIKALAEISSAYGEGLTNITCEDEIEPVIDIVKESKETAHADIIKFIANLLPRIEALENKGGEE